MRSLFFGLCLFGASPLFGQFLEPLYKFTLHFEDAIGNRDSVVMGFDSLAWPLLDADFGEINIFDRPFDSVFEVRGCAYDPVDFHSKIVVHYHAFWMCQEFNRQYQSFVIRAKHFPVLMWWDAAYFGQRCLEKSHLTRNLGVTFSHGFLFDPYDISMSGASSLVIDRAYLENTDGFRNTEVFEVENGERDTMYYFFLGISAEGVAGNFEAPAIPIELSPNPVSDVLKITVPDTGNDEIWMELCDVNGRVLLRKQTPSHQQTLLEVGGLVPGLYLVRGMDQERRTRFTGKVVIQP